MTETPAKYSGFPATDDAERERMVNLVHPLHETKARLSVDRSAERATVDMLKDWLATHDEKELWDDERGEGVRQIETAGQRWIDYSGVTPSNLQMLAEEGCLNLDARQWDALKKRSATNPRLLDLVNAVKSHVHQDGGTRLTAITESDR